MRGLSPFVNRVYVATSGVWFGALYQRSVELTSSVTFGVLHRANSFARVRARMLTHSQKCHGSGPPNCTVRGGVLPSGSVPVSIGNRGAVSRTGKAAAAGTVVGAGDAGQPLRPSKHVIPRGGSSVPKAQHGGGGGDAVSVCTRG